MLGYITEAQAVLQTIASQNARLCHRVVINTYAMRDPLRPVMYEETFLRNLAEQNFENYALSAEYPDPVLVSTRARSGRVIWYPITRT